MLILTIDTATPELVVGIVRHDPTNVKASVTLAETIVRNARAHNEVLVPTVQELLATLKLEFADLAAIVVGCGPGPFTGLRVGMATAAAFGDALGIPVYGVATHDAIAYEIATTTNMVSDKMIVATDARRKEIYWSSYEHGVLTRGPEVCAPGKLGEPGEASDHGLTDVSCVNIPDALHEKLPATLADVPHVSVSPSAISLIAVADFSQQPGPLEPLYLRRPDAKEPKPQPQSSAIPAPPTTVTHNV
ncbi:tRNA (adenosine(37)-N6)-threonylcarbamoyltransferase complex dimerization subunit type 1 TsaB [Corynebacterium sp. HS2168-gen11]|uniref:tRNA (adenosine(37)-N6)-threonylcarbamoyltransferase complex dimerization subunit type 1 TsaB n=1 Tax=Corynebacterium sp. HS2168-gen11 TaxID=2974027 RepID=UPI00216ADDB1|nr:tRNA (adenosine(37)-N6)-threonylcarbamoyltransferase complex dimerization subunit type 1 TsaB [Corynebacterium sp. HS2168-gen11]MCS4535638.1 tRNA (adenosine(37)-N6)-threonylcarbamoyltransferase complex dimerization subunit type 1 TsaB [Corynebacterium sp. HS2168-gen11]